MLAQKEFGRFGVLGDNGQYSTFIEEAQSAALFELQTSLSDTSISGTACINSRLMCPLNLEQY